MRIFKAVAKGRREIKNGNRKENIFGKGRLVRLRNHIDE